MALDKKFDFISTLGGDVLVIQECSRKSIDRIKEYEGYGAFWYGENKNKGLGIIARSPWKITEPREFGLQWIAASRITGPISLDVIGVWACGKQDYEKRYIRQVHGLIDVLEKSGLSENTILLGDFNSNSVWDKNYNSHGHTSAVARLHDLGLFSAYHGYFGEKQGSEISPTLYFRKQRSAGYHIDYIFMTTPLLESLKSVMIGSHDDWILHSDHMPLFADIG
jgi:exonuclease III